MARAFGSGQDLSRNSGNGMPIVWGGYDARPMAHTVKGASARDSSGKSDEGRYSGRLLGLRQRWKIVGGLPENARGKPVRSFLERHGSSASGSARCQQSIGAIAMPLTPEERAFLDAFVYEATNGPPFGGPATRDLNRKGIWYPDLSWILTAYQRELSAEGKSPSGVSLPNPPPSPWKNLEQVKVRNQALRSELDKLEESVR
jgi:hypothetical protein